LELISVALYTRLNPDEGIIIDHDFETIPDFGPDKTTYFIIHGFGYDYTFAKRFVPGEWSLKRC
jgi:hypothetical protein